MFRRSIILLGLAAACWAQPARLKVNVTAGEGAVNNIGMRVAAQPAVQIVDERDVPVAGAEVTFYAPVDGPGGSFFGVVRANTVKSDAKGIAQASGFTPNDLAGKFQILVRATAGGATAEGVVNQTNGRGAGGGTQASAGKNKKLLWTVLAIGAAAAIGGGVAANSGSSPAAAAAAAKRPITIGAGPINVGGPR